MTETRHDRPAPQAVLPAEEEAAWPAGTTPAIPMSLLALMTSDDAGADERIWDWSEAEPIAAPSSEPPTTEPAAPESAGSPELAPPTPVPGTEPTELAELTDVTGEMPPAAEEAVAAAPATTPADDESATLEPVEPTELEVASDEVELTGDDLSGDAGLAAWGQQVRDATARRIRAPKGVDPTPATGRIAHRVAGVRRREGERRIGSARDLKKRLPLAPDLPPGLPAPPPIPLKEVEDKVAGALKKQLPQQVLPALVDYTYTPGSGKPQVFHPQVAALRLPEGSATVLTPVPPPAKGKREGKDKVDALKKPGELEGAAPVASGAFILGTTPAPGAAGARPAPKVSKADITTVLARLRASIPADAKAMLTGIRAGMYKHNAFVIPPMDTFGEAELRPELEQKVTLAVDAIATQSGIDLAALHAATVNADGTVTLAEQDTKAKVSAAQADARKETEKQAQDSKDQDAGTAGGAHADIDEKLLQAQGGANPAAIRDQRDRLILRANRRLAPDDLRYEKEGADRQRALSLMLTLYLGAYQDVARRVTERRAKDALPPGAKLPPAPPAKAEPPPPLYGPPTASDAWAADRWKDVRTAFEKLQKDAADATAAQRAGIVAARDFARTALFEWADREIGERVSWWEWLRDRVDSWGKQSRAETDAWEEARAATLGVDLRGDLAFVDELASGVRTQAEIEAVGALGGLSEAQQAIVKAYFAADPKTRDPLAAVAAGMRVRITDVYRPGLVERLNTMLLGLPKDRWLEVAVVAEADGDNKVSIEGRGRQFHASVDQWGTDEDKLYAALTGLTPLQRHALDLWYQQVHGSTIDAELKDELDDAELDRAQALMAGNELLADAAAIRDAIEGPGTDEEEIYRALRNKTAEQRAKLEELYLSTYKVTLEADLASDLSDQELARAEALRAGKTAMADAIGLEVAQSGKWYGGADTDAIQKIYATNRTELQDQATREGWDSTRLNQQILTRNGAIDEAHRQQYRDAKGDPGPGLVASFERHLRGPALDLAVGLQEQDWGRADAARLELEKRSFITDDKVVNSILQSQYERAEVEVRLDAEHDLAYRQDLAAVRGEKWDPKAQREEMEKSIVVGAKARGAGYMQGLRTTYDDKYQKDPLSLMHGRGGFAALIDDQLMGSDQDRARMLVAQGGYLSAAQEIKYAVQGAGTDLDVLHKMLDGRSKSQIRAIEADWDKLYPDGPKLRDRIMDDVSGRDAIDLSVSLFAAESPREKLAAAQYRQKFEHDTFSLGGLFASDERKALDADVARMAEMVDAYEKYTDPKTADPAKAEFYKWRIDQDQMAVDSAIEEHRRSADSVTDKLAMIAAVVAGAVVTALTWGAAGPFVAGALGALAAAEATILTKIAVKGAAYSQEELLVDVVSGAVDVIMALATAGIGNALMRVSKAGVPLTRLAKLAASASRAKRILAHGIKEGVEGMVGGVASGAAGVLADEKTWQQHPGDALKGVLAGSAMGGAGGLVMGGVVGGVLGGWKAPPTRIDLPTGSSAEAVSRAAQWHAHSQKKPGASYAEFLADLEAGAITPDPGATARFHKAAQEQLAAGLPAADRRLVEGLGVTVLSDAEFERVTRSATGQAVTVIENGKPRIVMRESAPLSALREEGIHAAQALDPRFAKHFRLLDEAVLANWDHLDLRTKLAIYAAKLDLEIDANAKLLLGLVDEIDGLPPSVARGALIDQADATRRTLGNLRGRRFELASFGPLERFRARFGGGPLGEALDQTPRLFMKKSKTVSTKKSTGKKKAAKAPATKPSAPAPDPAQWGKPPDNASAARRGLGPHERSPQMSGKDVHSVEQVGLEWRDRSFRGDPPVEAPGGDRYRRVEVTRADASSPTGRRTEFVDETVVRGSNPPRWWRRGKDAGEAGALAEEASLAMTRRYISEAKERGITVVTLGSSLQNESGHGFDEVYFEFHPDGRIEIVLVEVKHYRQRRVPFDDFTAVTKNLEQNLKVLFAELSGVSRSNLPHGFRDLEPGQLRALRKRVAKMTGAQPDLTLEVRPGPTTALGGEKATSRADTALRKLEDVFPQRAVRYPQPADPRLSAADIDLVRKVAALDLPAATASRLLDVHGSLTARGIVDADLTPVPGQKGLFTGASGDATRFRTVSSDEVGRGARLDRDQIEKVARETALDLVRQVDVPGHGRKNLKVILDLADLDLHTRLWLEHAIDRQLALTGRSSELRPRLHIE